MKVSGAKQVHYDSGPNMTPLVDVVMVILIFLMLAGNFGTNEHYMISKTPMHATGGGKVDVDPAKVAQQVIEVWIQQNGDFRFQNQGGAATAWQHDPEDFKSALEQKAGQFKAAGGLDNVEIVLKPAANTKWQALAPLYAAALRANYTKVAFAMSNGGR